MRVDLLAIGDAQDASDNAREEQAGESTATVVLTSEVEWEKLNPARGDKSPKAGTLWGDRKGTVATGFLVKFVDGFRSPPHTHNVSYRALVIRGLLCPRSVAEVGRHTGVGVVEHKRRFYPAAWARFDLAAPGALKLVPQATRVADLRRDYAAMQIMFFGPRPDFEELLTELEQLERVVNEIDAEGAEQA